MTSGLPKLLLVVSCAETAHGGVMENARKFYDAVMTIPYHPNRKDWALEYMVVRVPGLLDEVEGLRDVAIAAGDVAATRAEDGSWDLMELGRTAILLQRALDRMDATNEREAGGVA